MSCFKISYSKIIFLLIIFISYIAFITGCIPENECTSNEDCSETEYCSKAAEDCEGDGKCETKPAECPEILTRVCGCDGNTYDNDCLAAEVGVNVGPNGECEPENCWDSEMCGEGNYCFFADCALETGICQPIQEGCPDNLEPVCGCNGNVYDNDCFAAASGASVDFVIPENVPIDEYPNIPGYPGICEFGCTSDDDCASLGTLFGAQYYYCKKTDGDCDGQGMCVFEFPGHVCTLEVLPVCGCDGITYSNECFAKASIAYRGECTE